MWERLLLVQLVQQLAERVPGDNGLAVRRANVGLPHVTVYPVDLHMGMGGTDASRRTS
jgi:hypothetical protein